MSSTQQLLLGEGAGGAAPVYIEDVFSTWLYDGNSSTQTITNGIELSTKGGLVWLKARNQAYTAGHVLTDTVRGAGNLLRSQTTNGNEYDITQLSAFTSSGFTLGTGVSNISPTTYVSWTFREQPKFFDVVTYTGTGSNTTIAHNLGSVPGCIIVKRTSTGGTNWAVYHRSLANTEYILLNTTAAKATGATYWNSTTPTSTVFSLGTDAAVNGSGSSYVAYIFAHDAGGFGLTGTDNVISCGSFTTNASGIATVTLGYEPQWVLIKRTDSPSEWHMIDNMRGFSQTIDAWLRANSSAAENSTYKIATPTATGFVTDGTNIIDPSSSFIYIAIRRGPMKVPTSGTSVFVPLTYTGNGGTNTLTSSFAPDVSISSDRSATYAIGAFLDKLRGYPSEIQTWTTNGESTYSGSAATEITAYRNTGVTLGSSTGGAINTSGTSYATYLLGRAPSFFDEVCYTGTADGATQISHNLSVTPELVICKSRSSAVNWSIACNIGSMNYVRGLGSAFGFNSTNAATQTVDFTGVISSTYFKPQTIFGASNDANQSGVTYVAYLFATCAGVSKVGTYTGTGTLTTVNCGFSGGARFVMIKRTDTTGGWYFWDTARGMVSATDPSLRFNAIAAESNANSVYTATTGFQLLASPAVDVNTSGGTYIYLAIA